MIATDFYGRVAADYDSTANRVFYQTIADRLLNKVTLDSVAPRILEIGAGTGFATARLAARYPRAPITALEPSAAMLARGKTTCPKANWLGVKSPHIAGEAFDLVIAVMSYHWLSLEERLRLMEISRRGVLALAVPTTGKADAAGNKILRRLVRETKRSTPWPREIRSSERLTDLLREHWSEVTVETTEIVESHANMRSLARALYVRGSLLALFGDKNLEARERLSSLPVSGTVDFIWNVSLLVARNSRCIT